MPELPEVEVIRRGLAAHVVGRRIDGATFFGPRVTRRHVPGPADLAERVGGSVVREARRRGKYLWLVLAAPDDDAQGLVIHLGMSGQLLVEDPGAPRQKHLRAAFDLAGEQRQLRFVDQRTFGGIVLARLGEDGIPVLIRHIAPDPLEAGWDAAAVVRRLKSRDSAIKRALLDQSLVSGIGNIYADEALWRAGVHGERIASGLTRPTLGRILEHARAVMLEAIGQGGTSFDALYVDVDGASGYFDRSLSAYGQQGRPCPRCGAPIRREAFMNRSSFFCPRCQPRPRARGGKRLRQPAQRARIESRA